MSALLIYPTHQNINELVAEYAQHGVTAVAYPPRLTKDSEYHVKNCENTEADEAEQMGLSVVKAVCSGCTARKACAGNGYLADLMRAEQATVTLATHARAQMTSLSELAGGRDFVSIHEDPTSLLRPRMSLYETDLALVQAILSRALNDPRILNWFAAIVRDDDEEPSQSRTLQERRDAVYRILLQLADLADSLAEQLRNAPQSLSINPPHVGEIPRGTESTLFWLSKLVGATFTGQPWRFVLAAYEGRLETVFLYVPPPSSPATDLVRQFVGYGLNPPPDDVVWINDATADADTLSRLLGRPVQDRTPEGRIQLQRKAVQIVRDVTRKSSNRIVANVIQGVLVDRPRFTRVGVITHRPQLKALDALAEEFRSRIVMSTYFGSGQDRSSNDWQKACDLILIVGTPRVAPQVVAEHLARTNHIGAACVESEWCAVHWEAETESGQRIVVPGRGYRDPEWREAHRALVRSALIQAIGRGRGILETGCEVVVLSNEECGLPISDAACEPLGATGAAILAELRRATLAFSIRDHIENASDARPSAVSTAQLASAVGIAASRMRDELCRLERRGLVRKIGERGGWSLVSHPAPERTEPESEGPAVADSPETQGGVHALAWN